MKNEPPKVGCYIGGWVAVGEAVRGVPIAVQAGCQPAIQPTASRRYDRDKEWSATLAGAPGKVGEETPVQPSRPGLISFLRGDPAMNHRAIFGCPGGTQTRRRP